MTKDFPDEVTDVCNQINNTAWGVISKIIMLSMKILALQLKFHHITLIYIAGFNITAGFFHSSTVHLDIIRVFFIYQLMHKRVALKRILILTLKQLRHVSV
jgi:hypothetical protein